MNRSFFLSLAACRRRSSAWLTRARFSARCVLCWPAFPSIPALRSPASVAGRPALFGAFTATTTEPDFSKTPCQTVTYPSRPSCAIYREASSRVELRRSRCFVARLRKCPARPGSDGSPTLQLRPAVHHGRPDRRVCRHSPYRSPPVLRDSPAKTVNRPSGFEGGLTVRSLSSPAGRWYGAGGEEMAPSSLYLTDGVPCSR